MPATLSVTARSRARSAIGDVIGAEEAVELGLVDVAAPVIGDFIVELDGVESEVVEVGDERRREPVTQVRFAQLPLAGQLLHTVASPPVAYLLFVIGLALIVFELFTAGVGVAGVVGAGCLILGSYGLAALPTNRGPWACCCSCHVRLRHRRADRGATGLDGHRHRRLHRSARGLYDGLSLSWLTLLVGIVGMAWRCSRACRRWCAPASPRRRSAASG